jgi:hypothetical protein
MCRPPASGDLVFSSGGLDSWAHSSPRLAAWFVVMKEFQGAPAARDHDTLEGPPFPVFVAVILPVLPRIQGVQ